MNLDTIYLTLNGAVMPAWLLLAIAPRWVGTRVLVHSFAYPVVYGICYFTFLLAALVFGYADENAGMSSINEVSALFSHPVGVLTGWTHYLVFDLFVGAWISRDAIERGVRYWLVVPCLFFTLMFGPVGLLLYFFVRLGTGRGRVMLAHKSDQMESNE